MTLGLLASLGEHEMGEGDSSEEKAGLIQAVAGNLGVCSDLQI